MKKIIKSLSIFLFLCLGHNFSSKAEQIDSYIRWSVKFPSNNKDWGVYTFDGSNVPSIKSVAQSKQTGHITFQFKTPLEPCVLVPSDAVLIGGTATGGGNAFKIAPCGDTGCVSNGASPLLKCVVGNRCTQKEINAKNTSKGMSAFAADLMYARCSFAKTAKCNGSSNVNALLYAQATPFITSQTLQDVQKSYCGSIDISPYFPASNQAERFQAYFYVDLTVPKGLPDMDEF